MVRPWWGLEADADDTKTDSPGAVVSDGAIVPTEWLFGVVALDDDAVFGEALRGLLQFTGATAAAITAPSRGERRAVAHAFAAPPGAGGRESTPPVRHRAVITTVASANQVELVLGGPAPIPDDCVASVGVVTRLLGRLLEERRTRRLPTDTLWGLVIVKNGGQVRLVSPRVCAQMGYVADEMIGRNVFEVIHADDHEMSMSSLAHTAAVPGEKYPLDIRFLHDDGGSRVWEVTAEDRLDASIDDIVFTARPADERSRDDALIGEQARVLDRIGRGESVTATFGEIARLVGRRLGVGCALLRADRPARRLCVEATDGLGPELADALEGTPISADANTCGVAVHHRSTIRSDDLLADDSWAEHRETLAAAGFGACWVNPIDSPRIDEPLGALACFGPSGWAPSPEDMRVAFLFTSMASVAVQRSSAEADLHHQAMHDPLTGLPNRALFLDLDRFKVINDALGHEAGDELLIGVAQRIESVTRIGTSVARFGGDEFTLLVDAVASPREAVVVAERVVEAFHRPITVAGTELVMTVSIGVVTSGDERVSAATMLRDADAAMYRAKNRGRNRVELFDDRTRSVAVARLDLEHALRLAVARGDFALHYQPEIDLERLEVVGTEALLRWSHPVRGEVPPADFIPVAEETGAIVDLGEWVLVEACRQLARWDAAVGAGAPRMWVNLSAVQLLDRTFPDRVERLLASTGTRPDRLGLEITESALMGDVEGAIASLTKLRELGVQTAIDDFGTGHASLASLRRLPIDLVKLDRVFVHDLGVDRRGHAMFEAIVDLVHAAGARVVAEGVETELQFDSLRRLGCDAAQGYWLGRPAAAGLRVPAWSRAG